MALTIVKRPVPLLVRKKWKEDWVTNAIVVSDEGAIGTFWLYVWGLALYLFMDGNRLRQAAGSGARPARC